MVQIFHAPIWLKKTLCHITRINADCSQSCIVLCLVLNVELLWIKLSLITFSSRDIVNTINVNDRVSWFQVYQNKIKKTKND